MKRVELHVHLEGCVWKNHIEKWHDKSLDLFPNVSPPLGQSSLTFDEFLRLLRAGYNYLNGPDQYVDVLSNYLEYMEKHKIVYAEIQLNIALLNTFSIELEVLLKAFNRICQPHKNKCVRFIVDLPWQFSPRAFEFLLKDYEKYKELGVVGISMGGDESLAKPKDISAVFNKARAMGYKTLCHAGETTSLSFARSIITELNPDRIGHGLSLSKWMMAETQHRFVVDSCISSNLYLGLVKDIQNHPANIWLKQPNIVVTLSTDDPAIFDTTLTKEYRLAEEYFSNYAKYVDRLDELFLASAFDQESMEAVLIGC